MVENSGGCCKLRIEARVRRRDALESYWQELGLEVHARERIELDPVAGRGGRSWGRKLSRGSTSG